MITLSPAKFLTIVLAAALSGTIAAIASTRGIVLPVVVVELIAGVIVGPHVIGLKPDGFILFFADLGLGLLFFFAGYEIDLRRISGQPLRLALLGWAISLALAYTIGGILAALGIVLSLLYTGSALATTAIGTLIPILSDSGELRTRFGTYLLAVGAVGEFGPIVLLTLFLSTAKIEKQGLILLAFVLTAVAVAVIAVRSSARTIPLFERTLESSSQLAVRWIVVLVFALAYLASQLGLDLLLGGFAAGRHHPPGAEDQGDPGVRLQAHRGRVRGVRAVLLHRQRDEPRHHRAVCERRRRPQAVPVLLPVPGRARHSGDPPLPARAPRPPDADGARVDQLDAAAAGAGDHRARARQRPHASLDCGRAGRRRRAVVTLVFPVLGLRIRGDLEPEPQDETHMMPAQVA